MYRSRLSGREIKSTARQIYDELEAPESDRLELSKLDSSSLSDSLDSNGWLSRFQTRHGLKLHRRHCDTLASSDEVDVEAERSNIRDDITMFLAGNEGGSDGKASRSLDDVWSMEMSTVYLGCSPIKDVDGASKCRKRTRISVGLAVNVTGTEHFEPIFIERDGSDQQAFNFKHYTGNTEE
ncbi:hypothetical protein PR003_g11222 [Phytophthora rubi]|uniref:HTH CENPB-type domain-containing protein n=1 Tax=Phytophthora rubi TaxID=129364 RepID=A0A6A3MKB9_9STRA|nr:hypothetical protein PR002_g8823 [Phytophthora rubi]KAE9037442.1 hypothetical protein PR001_g8377 [Phytophthora rubi]KAE9339035.1 hypothetical protein PR003_g11222 [Phytophthora rubi]